MLDRSSSVKQDFNSFFRDGNRSKSLQKRREYLTVCIAAICGAGDTIITAADRMVTSGDVTFEVPGVSRERQIAPILKVVPLLDHSIVIMTAGDAGFQADAMHNIWATLLKRRADGAPQLSVREIAYLYLDFCIEFKRATAESLILRPFGLASADFIAQQRTMSDKFVETISSQIQNIEITDSIIVAGIDSTGAHIYLASGEGVSCCDSIAFAAIGSGSRHAESQFMIGEHTRFSSLDETMLLTYVAKKRSEVAPGVGTQTDMLLINPITRRMTNFSEADIDRLDSIYESLKSEQEIAVTRAKGSTRQWLDGIRNMPPNEPSPTSEPPSLPNPSEPTT